MKSIVIDTSGVKTTYAVGEAFNTDNLKVSFERENGRKSQVLDISDCSFEGYDMQVSGTQTVTVIYEGRMATYTITVSD